MKMYRQGDILIIEVVKIHNEAELDRKGVVAYGETTGHAHVLQGDGRLLSLGEQMFIEAGVQTKLVHDEHETIEIPQGKYRVIRQREWDEGEIRRVSD